MHIKTSFCGFNNEENSRAACACACARPYDYDMFNVLAVTVIVNKISILASR